MIIFRRDSLTIFIVLLIAALMALVVPAATDHDFFIMSVLTSALLWSVYVASWDLLAGYTGLFSMGHMVFAGTAAYAVALLEVNCDIARHFVILAGFAAGIFSALIIGLPSLRVRSLYFVVVSFVLPTIMQRITMSFTTVFGGEYGLSIERAYARETMYYTAIVLMVVTLIVLRIVVKSRIGMTLKSIREDEETARAIGINVPLYKLLSCVISAAFASLAGICDFYNMSHVDSGIFSIMSSFNVVIMGLGGGIGTLFGGAVAGGVLTLLAEVMRPIAEYRNISYAALLVVVVMLFPKGVWGELGSIWQKKRLIEVKTSRRERNGD